MGSYEWGPKLISEKNKTDACAWRKGYVKAQGEDGYQVK
jgi:hypothetical protein